DQQQRARVALHKLHLARKLQLTARQIQKELVRQLDGGRFQGEDVHRRFERVSDGAEMRNPERSIARARDELDLSLEGDGERAFRPNQDVGEIERSGTGKSEQVIAADAALNFW